MQMKKHFERANRLIKQKRFEEALLELGDAEECMHALRDGALQGNTAYEYYRCEEYVSALRRLCNEHTEALALIGGASSCHTHSLDASASSSWINQHIAHATRLIESGSACKRNGDAEGYLEFHSDAIFELYQCVAASADEKQRKQLRQIINTLMAKSPGLREAIEREDADFFMTAAEEQDKKMPIACTTDQRKDAECAQFSSVYSKITFADVAGLESAKQALQEAAVLPRMFPQLFQKRNPWKSILLYGVPGTGKTFLAKALAGELKSTFLSVNPSDIMGKYMGESERAVRALFHQARKEAPAVIFIDEIDSFLSRREDNENEASKRVKTEFMIQIEGVGVDNKDVLLVGATNYPNQLDPAVLRRFEKRIVVGLPDFAARRQIIKTYLQDICNTVTDDEVGRLEEVSAGYSASDLISVMKQAIMLPIRQLQYAEYFQQDEQGNYSMATELVAGAIKTTLFQIYDRSKIKEPPVTLSHVLQAFYLVKKTVSGEDIARIDKFTAEFGGE